MPYKSAAQSSLLEAEKAASAAETADFNEEVRFPTVGTKLRPFVKAYMQEIAKGLYRDGYNVETMREGEVVIVVIPTDQLFVPNEGKLMQGATKKIDPIAKFLANHHDFKILICVHTDDTGSENYLLDLSELRVNAILDYFESKHYDISDVIGFPMGMSQPLAENDTRANRSLNRRVEFYIVPNDGLITKARGKK